VGCFWKTSHRPNSVLSCSGTKTPMVLKLSIMLLAWMLAVAIMIASILLMSMAVVAAAAATNAFAFEPVMTKMMLGQAATAAAAVTGPA
jgi:hypothetical protein